MATIKSHLEAAQDLTVITLTGHLTARELLEASAAFYAGRPTRLSLWDFAEVTTADVETDDLMRLARQIKAFIERRKQGRTAIVKSKHINVGVIKMFRGMAALEGLPYDYRIFRTRTEARRWLGVKRVADGMS